MPPSLRRRAQQQHLPPPENPDDTDSEIELTPRTRREHGDNDNDTLGNELLALEEEDELDEEDALASPDQPNIPVPNLDPPPSYLREISTLASWTVSSSKPGCSVPQLRHPSTSLFWQSDGPQPHYLNIHFFKLVRIVGLRLYLDFEQDESYTPTRIIFLAGSGMNDLQEWGEMRLESPRGWIWADFSGVGDPDTDDDDLDEDDVDSENTANTRLLLAPPPPPTEPPINTDASSDSENAAPRPQLLPSGLSEDQMQIDNQPAAFHTPVPTATQHHLAQQTPQNDPTAPTTLTRPTPRAPFTALSPNTAPHRARNATSTTPKTPKMPVLRAHLVQIKILENHQNGKDTHLRGLQIFARNDEEVRQPVRSVGADAGRKALLGEESAGLDVQRRMVAGRVKVGERARRVERLDLGTASRSAWDVEPSIR